MAAGIVLCVDDDVTVLNAMRTVLRATLGSAVLVEVAQSGAEGLEICQELKEKGQEIDLVISDYIMPGMRGDDFLIQLHARSPRTIKIMLTGQSDLAGVKRTVNEASLYRFMEKPFNNADFILTVKSALRAYAMERDAAQGSEGLRRKILELQQALDGRTRELVVLREQIRQNAH